MQATTVTSGWEELPDIPWATAAGTSYRDLGARTARLLDDIEEQRRTAGRLGLASLAVRLAELRAELHDLARSEIAVSAIYDAGTRHHPQRPHHLHVA